MRVRLLFAALCVALGAASLAGGASGQYGGGEEEEGSDMYCGNDSCYAVLGLERSCSGTEVRKAYRKLSLVYHPDKSSLPTGEATAMFRLIATAYEVLKDEGSRKEYDYMLDHPEEVMRNRYRYYRFRYARKTNPWFVVSGTLLVATVLHYLYWVSVYQYYRRLLRKHPKVVQRLEERRLELERLERERERAGAAEKQGGPRKRAPKAAAAAPGAAPDEPEDDLDGIVEVKGWQGRPPTWRDLLVLWIPKALWRVALYFYWLGRWYVKFTLLGHEYGREEREYITSRVMDEKLHVRPSQWQQMPEEERRRLTDLELWDKDNFREFCRELKNKRKKAWR